MINLKSFASGEFGSNYHNDKKLMWWFMLELYTKCKPKGLYQCWSCFTFKKIYELIDEAKYIVIGW